jgi:hypothetical protein
MIRVRSWLVFTLGYALLAQTVFAQNAQAGGLEIKVLTGLGTINNLPCSGQAPDSALVVQVRRGGAAVEGITVTFTLPSGPGGTFPQRGQTLEAQTGSNGQAGVLFTPDAVAGAFSVGVSAAYGAETARIAVVQTNVREACRAAAPAKAPVKRSPSPPPRRASHCGAGCKTLILLLVAGAGVGACLAAKSCGPPATTTPTTPTTPTALTIGLGSGSFGTGAITPVH